MRFLHLFFVIIASVFVLPDLCAEEKTVWRSSDGKKLKATLSRIREKSVDLRLSSNGKVVKVALSRLSKEDQKYIETVRDEFLPVWEGWPDELRMNLDDIEVELVEASEKDKPYVYATPHFELHSEVKLGRAVSLDVARIFELTYQLMEASPWGVMANPKDGKFRAELYGSRASYLRSGAPPNSGGVYMTREKVFKVPVESLGLKRGSSGYRRAEDYSLETVIHELAHMLMDEIITTSPIYIIEGIAEYMSLTPIRSGAYKPKKIHAAVEKRLKKRGVIGMEDLLSSPSSEWQSLLNDGSGIGADRLGKLYNSSLAAAYYFIHLEDPEEMGSLRRYLMGAKKRSKALNKYINGFERYREEIDEFKKKPGVKFAANGSFTYPSDLDPPKAPELPLGAESFEDLSKIGIDVLFKERDLSDVAADMSGKLNEKFSLRIR